jgi:hypothetical protein
VSSSLLTGGRDEQAWAVQTQLVAVISSTAPATCQSMGRHADSTCLLLHAGLLPPAAVLYLSAAVSSSLLTGGRDEQAWAVLEACQGVLGELHEAGADAALWHAAAGVALYHCDNLQVSELLPTLHWRCPPPWRFHGTAV